MGANFLTHVGTSFAAVGWLSTAVLANAGTPLMWAGATHLLFGNLVIGIGEGALLAVLFRRQVKLWHCVVAMIAANYFSAWLGFYCLSSHVSWLNLDLNNVRRWLWILMTASYLATIVLEWPFVAFCLRKLDGWFWKSLWGVLVTQSASYLVLFGWYWSVSGTSLLTTLSVVPPTQMACPADVLLYYIGEKDGDVYVARLDGRQTQRLCALGSSTPDDRLCVQKSSTAAGRWDLAAVLATRSSGPPEVKTLLADFAAEAVPDRQKTPQRSWFNFGEVPRFEATDENGWRFWTGFWPAEGIRGHKKKNTVTLAVSLETPFVAWAIRNATQLPNGQVVFQLDENQICLLDPDARTIALIAKGHGPVVAKKAAAWH